MLEKVTAFERFQDLYPQVHGLILRAIRHNPDFEVDTVEDITRIILQGEQQLWVDIDHEDTIQGMVLGQYIRYMRGYVFRLNCCAGEMAPEWFSHYLPQILDEAKSYGVTHFEIMGRAGWGRELKKLGFKLNQTQYTMKVDNGQQRQQSSPDDN